MSEALGGNNFISAFPYLLSQKWYREGPWSPINGNGMDDMHKGYAGLLNYRQSYLRYKIASL